MNKILISILTVLLISSCATAQKSGSYTEDLSVHRPTYQPADVKKENKEKTPEKTAKKDNKKVEKSGKNRNEQLQQISDSVIVKNQSILYANGFRVQVYSGTDKTKAMEARKMVLKRFPTINVHFIYHQPDWRIRVGDYDNRLEIQKVYYELKMDFPNALIVPDQIYISTEKTTVKLSEEPVIETK